MAEESEPLECPASELAREIDADRVVYRCRDVGSGERLDEECCADAFAALSLTLGCPWQARLDDGAARCIDASSGDPVHVRCCVELCDPASDYTNFTREECVSSAGQPVPWSCCERGTAVAADVCGGAIFEDVSGWFEGRSEYRWRCTYPDADAAALVSCCLDQCFDWPRDPADLPRDCSEDYSPYVVAECGTDVYADIRGACVSESLAYFATGCCRLQSDVRHPNPDDECHLTGASPGACNELVEVLVLDVAETFAGCVGYVSIDRPDLGLVGNYGVFAGAACPFQIGGVLTYQTHRLRLVEQDAAPPTDLPIELYLSLG